MDQNIIEAKRILAEAYKYRNLYQSNNKGKVPQYFIMGPKVYDILGHYAHENESDPSVDFSYENQRLFGIQIITIYKLGPWFLDIFNVTFGEVE